MNECLSRSWRSTAAHFPFPVVIQAFVVSYRTGTVSGIGSFRINLPLALRYVSIRSQILVEGSYWWGMLGYVLSFLCLLELPWL
mmetsp:Transcript_32418/g.5866  ORF Transcript_32418/g.5866 Transcript_32418/m.5866 type:complete len:84 (-) Transcript_32418:260-511(-)